MLRDVGRQRADGNRKRRQGEQRRSVGRGPPPYWRVDVPVAKRRPTQRKPGASLQSRPNETRPWGFSQTRGLGIPESPGTSRSAPDDMSKSDQTITDAFKDSDVYIIETCDSEEGTSEPHPGDGISEPGAGVTDQNVRLGDATTRTHSPEELLARYHKAMGGNPVADLALDEYTEQRLVVRAYLDKRHARPGGMVAGPILFTLADTAAYFVTISRCPKRSEAYTTSISMEFLRPAAVGILLVEGTLLRFGKRSCVVDTLIRHVDDERSVAHAVVTYAPVFPSHDAV